jgi:hypothetical protein
MSLWVASSVPTRLAFLVLVERGLSSGVERLLDDACACLEGRSASTAVLPRFDCGDPLQTEVGRVIVV